MWENEVVTQGLGGVDFFSPLVSAGFDVFFVSKRKRKMKRHKHQDGKTKLEIITQWKWGQLQA